MIHRCYSLFDRKALIYAPPIYSPTDGAAVRALADAVEDTRSPVGSHPTDYVLFFVGEYDDQKGQLTAVSPLVHVIDAIALVKVQAPLPFAPNGSGHRPDTLSPNVTEA